MTRFAFVVICLGSFCMNEANSRDRITREEYIQRYKNDAVKDMKLTGVPASITMAQALLESDNGNSPLAIEANNHFGIKCAEWTGSAYYQDDDARGECFRKYNSVLESYDDHSQFLRNRPRYSFLFELEHTDYKGWAHGLKKAGYATNPQYAQLLIKIIEENNLDELDKGNAIGVFASKVSPPSPFNKKTGHSLEVRETIDAFGKHEVFLNNNVKYVIAKKGDTYKKISEEFDMAPWEIFKYNEVTKDSRLNEGAWVYIKPKRNKSSQQYYTVAEEESLAHIAMKLGVKTKALCKYNNIAATEVLKPGTKLWLQNKRPKSS
jgi:LysM repeat protein